MGLKQDDVRRYWVEFDADGWGCRVAFGYGVTAYDREDALSLLRDVAFEGGPMPPVRTVIEDVDVSTLDEWNVLPNIAPPVWRGIWFPMRLAEWRER